MKTRIDRRLAFRIVTGRGIEIDRDRLQGLLSQCRSQEGAQRVLVQVHDLERGLARLLLEVVSPAHLEVAAGQWLLANISGELVDARSAIARRPLRGERDLQPQ